jgi:TonB family protein
LPIPRSATYVSREIKEHLSGLSYDITVFGGGTEKYNGEISIEFLLLKDGSIDDIRILRSDIESPEFQNELVTRVEKWRFCTASDDMIIVCNFDYRGNGD